MIYKIYKFLKIRSPLYVYINNLYQLIIQATSIDLYECINLLKAKKEKIKYFIFYPKNLIQEHNYKRMLLINTIKYNYSQINTNNIDDLKKIDKVLKQIAELEKEMDNIIRDYIANPININDKEFKKIRKEFRHIKIRIGQKNV